MNFGSAPPPSPAIISASAYVRNIAKLCPSNLTYSLQTTNIPTGDFHMRYEDCSSKRFKNQVKVYSAEQGRERNFKTTIGCKLRGFKIPK